METLAVCAGSMIDGITIAELDFEHRKLMLIGVVSANPTHQKHKNSYALKNQQFYFNPPPFFILQPDDLLVVLGRDIGIAYYREQLKNSRPKEPKR
jgi:voltage-gated potassium channel